MSAPGAPPSSGEPGINLRTLHDAGRLHPHGLGYMRMRGHVIGSRPRILFAEPRPLINDSVRSAMLYRSQPNLRSADSCRRATGEEAVLLLRADMLPLSETHTGMLLGEVCPS